MGEGGWPDHFWLYYYPFVVFIEFKAPEGRLALRQKLRIEELQRRGYPVKVIRDVQGGIAFLEAEILSGNCGKTRDLAGLRGLPDVSGNGEDNYKLRDLLYPEV